MTELTHSFDGGTRPAEVDPAIWRVVGSPLVAGAASGPLVGETVAVKDLFSVAGYATGGGVPEYLASAPIETVTSPAVTALLDAGASVRGIAQTDEFAFSIAGLNPHYGTPPNGAVVGGIPGGSSSGPASAVSNGQASIGLGTDTGGSIRVPASYQGLWGLRTTHGAVSAEGLLPLAPSFDTVGWMTRSAATLRAAAAATLDAAAQVQPERRYLVSPALLALCSPEVQDAFAAFVADLDTEAVELGNLDKMFETYRTLQGAEAWRVHGPFIEAHPDALGADVASRFAWASTVSGEAETQARAAMAIAEARMAGALGGDILLLPSASSAAPQTTAPPAEIESVRAATMRLTSIAGLSRRPGLSVPILSTPDGPVGLCLVGPRFSDLALIDIALELGDTAL